MHAIETTVPLPLDEAAVRATLADNGFGVLTEIDVAATQSAAEALLASWEAERRASEDRGAAQVAYRNGGVAQLRAIVADLAEVAYS